MTNICDFSLFQMQPIVSNKKSKKDYICVNCYFINNQLIIAYFINSIFK